MKHLLIATLISLFALNFSSFAQKNKKEPIIAVPEFNYDNASNLISYSEVVNCKGTTKEIYSRALKWMKTYYKNPTDVIKEQNMDAGMLLGKARFRIWDINAKTQQKTQAGLIQYEIVIRCKDGRYKFDITKIGHKLKTFFPAEKWDTENKKAYSRTYSSYLLQMDTEIKAIIESLKSSMAKAPEKTNDDW